MSSAERNLSTDSVQQIRARVLMLKLQIRLLMLLKTLKKKSHLSRFDANSRCRETRYRRLHNTPDFYERRLSGERKCERVSVIIVRRK